MSGEAPFLSIGVTTYDRPALLRESLQSILTQGFPDYEVLVGNDNPGKPLSKELLGVFDPRIRFVNHPTNLGEINNMNRLLEMSRGRYFTWLADDDLYAPEFLLAVHSALVEFGFPPCAFTSYDSGKTFEPSVTEGGWRMERYSGGQFLELYLSRKLRAIGCYGVFERDYLRRTGGVEPLGTGFSPYSDNLLAIRAGLLDSVGYVNAPLVFYRTHSGSVSYTSGDVEAFRSAQEALLRKSLVILRDARLSDRFAACLYFLLRWCLVDFGSVVRKAGGIGIRQAIAYVRFAFRHINLLRGSPQYWRGLVLLGKVALWTARQVAKARLKRWSARR